MSLSHPVAQQQIQSGQRLSQAEQTALDQHLASCPECRAYAAFHQQLLESLPNPDPALRHSEREIRERIRQVNTRLEKRRWPEWFFHNTLSLAGAAAALVLILVLFIALPRMMPGRQMTSPASAATAITTTSKIDADSTANASLPGNASLADNASQAGTTSPQATLAPHATVANNVLQANANEENLPSPDGRWTLVYQKQLGQAELVDAQGSRTRVGAANEWIIPGGWSPDSRSLVYWQGANSASIQADGISFWALQVATGQATQLAPAVLISPSYFSWAPDGHALVFTNGGSRSAQIQKWLSLYTVADQKVSDLVTQDKLVPGALTWAEQGIAIAAVEASHTGANYADAMNWQNPAILARRIFLVNPENGIYQRLNQDEAYQDAPRWGKDGNLYFVQLSGSQAQVMAASPVNGIAKALDGCQAALKATAGYYGLVDWSDLFNACPSVQTAGAAGTLGAASAQGTASTLIAQAEPVPSVALNGQMAFTGRQDRLIAVDFNQPAKPVLAAQSVALPGAVKKVIFMPGESRQRVAASAGRYLALFDVTTPGELTLLNQSKLPGPIYALLYDVNASRIYAGGSLYNDASKGFIVILDGSDNAVPADTLQLRATLQLAEPVQSLALANAVLYAAHNTGQPGIQAIQITKDEFGDPLEAIAASAPIYSMTAAGDGLYLGSDQQFWAYYLADPLHPTQTWQLSHANASGQSAPPPGKILGFELRANTIYTAGLMATGEPFRLAVTPTEAIKASSVVDTASYIAVSGGYMLVAGDSLEIYDSRDSQALKRVGVYP